MLLNTYEWMDGWMLMQSNRRNEMWETRLNNVYSLGNYIKPITEPQDALQIPLLKSPHLSTRHMPLKGPIAGTKAEPGAMPGEETCFSSKYSPGKLKAHSSLNPLSFSYRSHFLFL